MVAHGVREGGIDPQEDVGVELKILRRSIGRGDGREGRRRRSEREPSERKFSTYGSCDPRG